MINRQGQRGEMATLITIAAVILMTVGLFIGSAIVSNPRLTSFFSRAQSSSPVSPTANAYITPSFGAITTRNANQKQVALSTCFTPEYQNLPNGGSYFVEAHLVRKPDAQGNPRPDILIGNSLSLSIGSNREQARCTSGSRATTVFTYSSLAAVPGSPTWDQVDSVEFHIITDNGNWQPPLTFNSDNRSLTRIGILSDVSHIFGGPPPPTNTPTPAPQPTQCSQITSKVPASVLADALANPTSVNGWNLLEDPSQPESTQNRRRRQLTLEDINESFHPDTNRLMFAADCVPQVRVCENIRAEVPGSILSDAVANPSSIAGWNRLERPSEQESATNRRRIFLTLENINLTYATGTNDLAFKATCPVSDGRPGTITVQTKLDNTRFTDDSFDAFTYKVDTCSFTDRNADGTLQGDEITACGANGNKSGNEQIIRQTDGAVFTKTSTDTFADMPGGKRVIRISSAFWQNYGTSTAKKDNSGMVVDFTSASCTSKLGPDSSGNAGVYYCLVTVNSDVTTDIVIKLPDVNMFTFKLGYISETGASINTCSIVSDGSVAKNTPGNPCKATYDITSDTVTLDYVNTSAQKKIKWVLTRCHGDINANRNTCLPNTVANDHIKNSFAEADLFTVPTMRTRSCTLKLADYPIDDETDAPVRTAVKCALKTSDPKTTPNPTTDPESPVYYAIMSLYNASSRAIVHVKTTSCENGETCVDDEGDIRIEPQERELIEFKLGSITRNTRFFTVRVSVRREDETEEQPFAQELNVSEPQNVYYDLNVKDTGVEGTAKTELAASDISGNQCTNADDAVKVIQRLGDIDEDLSQCTSEDVNCDGAINTLDLSVILANLNQGSGCFFNIDKPANE